MKLNHLIKQQRLSVMCFLFLTLVGQNVHARSVELMGLVHYGIARLSPNPPTYKENNNAIGYGFLGRLELGPGLIETGFQYVPVGMTTTHSFGDLKSTAGYWTIPLMYRFPIYEPFVSIAAGLDYAYVGSTHLESTGNITSGLTSGYRSHYGFLGALEFKQDVGENLSLVLDVRFRQSLSDAISFSNTNSKLGWFTIGLGILKHLEI